MSRLYAQVAPVYIQVSPITVAFQLVEGWRYDRRTVLRKVASPNNTLRRGRPKGEGVVVKHWIQEIPMAPSVIAITKVSRKRRSFEAADTPQKTQCLSEAEYSDDDSSSPKSLSPQMDDDRRAHHNELERRRRDHIKDHFMSLKDAIPLLEGEKSSRALILKRAVEYISMMQKQIAENQSDIAQLRQQNKELETQIKALDKCRKTTPPFVEEEIARPSVSNLTYSVSPGVVGASISGSSLLPVPLSAPNLATIGQPSTASAFNLPSELNTTPHLAAALNPVSPTVEPQPATDVFRESIFRAVSNPLLNISSLLLANNPIKLNQPTIPDFDYAPDIHSRILANSLALQERQQLAVTAVRFYSNIGGTFCMFIPWYMQ